MMLSLTGLSVRPAQVWGSVRLVPLVRDAALTDLRLGVRSYDEDQLLTITSASPKTSYLSYVPHGMVVRWSSEGMAEVPVQTRLGAREVRQKGPLLHLNRMVRREAADQLRLLPLHTAMEGFLSLHFGGPDVAHRYYTSRFRRFGLDPRAEWSVSGGAIPGLDEALRLFEIHPGQCGVMLFVGDSLASAMVVAHPDDYLPLHRTLLNDFFGTIVAQFGWGYRRVPTFGVTLQGRTLQEIAASLRAEREGWSAFAQEMASGLFGRDVHATRLRKAGRYRLVRFATGFDVGEIPRDGEHLGEALVAEDGTLGYLKTYRLDRGQARRGHLLQTLAAHDWDLHAVAASQGHGKVGRVIGDLATAGLDWIVTEEMRSTHRLR